MPDNPFLTLNQTRLRLNDSIVVTARWPSKAERRTARALLLELSSLANIDKIQTPEDAAAFNAMDDDLGDRVAGMIKDLLVAIEYDVPLDPEPDDWKDLLEEAGFLTLDLFQQVYFRGRGAPEVENPVGPGRANGARPEGAGDPGNRESAAARQPV